MAARLNKSTVRLIIAIIFYFCYLLLGAAIFLRLERPREEKAQDILRGTYQQFLFDHSKCLTEYELDDFVQKINLAGQQGVRQTVLDGHGNRPSWSFPQAILFSATTLTTIGYGRMARLSNWGKVFCILYVLIGIPYTLILLTALLERLGHVTNRLLKGLNNRLGQHYKPLRIRLIHLFLIFLFVLLCFFIIPSLIFAAIEPHWSFLDAFYYCFISLTTIGYGDYVPTEAPYQKMRGLYKVGVTIYLLVGLLFMALLLSIAYEIPQLNMSHLLMENSDEDGENSHLTGASGGPNEPRYVRHMDDDSPINQSAGGNLPQTAGIPPIPPATYNNINRQAGGDVRPLHP